MPSIDLGGNWTPLVRNTLVFLFVVYVVQLVVGEPFLRVFAWRPIGDGFFPWQVLTSFALGVEPIGTVLYWLTLYFLLPPLDAMLDRRGLAFATLWSWFFAVMATFAALALGLPDVGFLGAAPILLAYTALFGFLAPEMRFLLFFVVPVKAKWLGWGGGLLAFLFFLFSPTNTTALSFFAWVGAWLWVGWRNGVFRRMRLRAERRRIEKRLARFEVIDGGRDEKDWIN